MDTYELAAEIVQAGCARMFEDHWHQEQDLEASGLHDLAARILDNQPDPIGFCWNAWFWMLTNGVPVEAHGTKEFEFRRQHADCPEELRGPIDDRLHRIANRD